jgi:hypothetical protein
MFIILIPKELIYMANFEKIEKEYEKEKEIELEKQIKDELASLDKQKTQLEIKYKKLKENPKEYFVEKSGAVYVVNGKLVDKDIYERYEEKFNKRFNETWKDFWLINNKKLLNF